MMKLMRVPSISRKLFIKRPCSYSPTNTAATTTDRPTNYAWKMYFVWIFTLGLLDPFLRVSGLEERSSKSESNSGPRFIDEWWSSSSSSTSSYGYSNRLGLSIRCGAAGFPPPRLQWFAVVGAGGDLVPAGNLSGLREVGESGLLRLNPFPLEKYRPDIHSTSYRCKATNTWGTIISPELNVLSVLDSPFEIENRDVSVPRGNTAVLRCRVPEQLRDFVTVTSWVQDASVNIYPNFHTGKWLMLPSGELYVFNVEKGDGQKPYSCRTLHKLTNEVRTGPGARIIVKELEGPEPVRLLVERERRIRARSGDELFLPCLAHSNPPPTYSWYKVLDVEGGGGGGGIGGSGGLSSSLIPIQSGRSPSGAVHLSQVRLEDGGSYFCRVNNSHSADQAGIILSVYVPLRVQISQNSQIIDVGRSAVLRCLISGSPIHRIEWYKDGLKLSPSTASNPTTSKYSIAPKDTLKIFTVHPHDAGIYQCLVYNDLYAAQDSAQIRLGSVLPELLYRFTEQTIQPGPSVSLKCTAGGLPPPHFIWTLDGFPLPENERYLVGQYVTIHDNVISHVNITHVLAEDGGTYTCTAQNAMGTSVHSARLNIYGPPFVRSVPPVKAVAGKSLQLQCPVSGYPIESIVWERGGSSLPVTRLQRSFPNGTLLIDHIQKSDEGLLTCVAKGRVSGTSSSSSSHSRDIQIKVIVPPKIMPFQFMNNVMREGLRAAVSCQLLEGDRPIDIIWEFDGAPLLPTSSGNGINIRVPDEYSSTLIIESLSSSHNGRYTCIAENSAGREQYSSELTVQIPPKWTVEPRDINVSSGHSLSLHCLAEGHPVPSINWKRATGSVPGDVMYKDVLVGLGGNHSLRFDAVKKSDEGSYLCEAYNGVNGVLSKLIFLKVNAPASFLEKDQQISVRSGEKGILQCRARGDPPIKIQWGSNNKYGGGGAGGGASKPIGPHTNHRYTVREQEMDDGTLSELVIANVDRSDGGGYTCQASNDFGGSRLSITLNVQEPPEQPGNLRVVEVGSRSVQISWLENFNGNSPLINFIIQSKFPSETWTEAEVEELAVPGTQSTALIEALSPSTTYHLRVLAQNGVGFSPPSEIVQVTTQEEAPEGAPLDLIGEALSSTKLRVRWGPPERAAWNGPILGYYLGYRELEHGSETASPSPSELLLIPSNINSHLLPPSSSSHLGELHGYHFKTVEVSIDFGAEAVIENLKKYTRYAVVVQGFNSKGAGPLSAPIVATTLQDVPSLPPGKFSCTPLSPQSLSLSWEPPPLEGRHGIIQGYRVEPSSLAAEDGEEEEMEPLLSPDPSLILHGLRKWTNYSFVVRAFTGIGEGKGTPPLHCRTDEDVPSPPAEVKTIVSSRRSILISWLPPSQPNGKILKYTVYSRVVDGAKVEKKVGGGGDSSLEWSGLKEASGYEFWVSCTTSVGEGLPSTRTRVLTTNKVPARIGSFGGEIETPWKRELTLDCLYVGIPEPNVEWAFNGGRISSSTKREVLHGKLTLKEVLLEDSGNYSCSAANSHGRDEISYRVRVLGPPGAPLLEITESSHHSFRLAWSMPNKGGARVRGYLINHQKEGGEWEETGVGPRALGHLLESLDCGSTYHLFITAFNRIGTGPPSPILTRTTKGHAPASPKKDSILHYNHSTIALQLDQWEDNGCPIQSFMIEYKASGEKSWMRIPSSLAGDAKSYTFTGLHPKTKYEVRVTAGNNAGQNIAKYDFLTGPSSSNSHHDHSTNPAHEMRGYGKFTGSSIEGVDDDEDSAPALASPLSTSLLIVFPFSLITVGSIFGFICFLKRKRRGGGAGGGGEREEANGPKSLIGEPPELSRHYPPNYADHSNSTRPSYAHPHGQFPHPQNMNYMLVKGGPDLTATYVGTLPRAAQHNGAEYVDEVCPYATFQLPENPPNRPLLTKGFHTGDTLYNVGNVYSGPYHAVQSQPNSAFLYSQSTATATLPIRDAEYLKIGRKFPPNYGVVDCDDEVQKIMNLNSSDYDTIGSPEMSSKMLQRQMLQMHQDVAASHHRQRNANAVPRTPADVTDPSSSSTEEEESSPTTRKSSYAPSSRSRTKSSKSSLQSGSSKARVRSSSGYSSHTEETSFTYAGGGGGGGGGGVGATPIQPPSRFTDSREMSDLGIGEEQESDNKYGTNKRGNKRERGPPSHPAYHHKTIRDGSYHIDV